jgi:hypothetical protein
VTTVPPGVAVAVVSADTIVATMAAGLADLAAAR